VPRLAVRARACATTNLSAAPRRTTVDTRTRSSTGSCVHRRAHRQEHTITLDRGVTDALTALKLTPGVLGGAKLTAGSLVFPITGGNVTYFEPGTASPYVVGQIQHEGSGLSLAASGTTVHLTNLNVDPTVSRVYGDVTVNGEVAATGAFLFAPDGRTLEPLRTDGGTAILQGTKVAISDDAAPVLNKVLHTTAVKPNLLVGDATITVNAQ
jgi:hypothetical protein